MSKEDALLDFLSRECRKLTHYDCGEEWSGFGVRVRCNCRCHGLEQKTIDTDCDEVRIHPCIALSNITTQKIQNQPADLASESGEQLRKHRLQCLKKGDVLDEMPKIYFQKTKQKSPQLEALMNNGRYGRGHGRR